MSFDVSADAYGRFMGRYSEKLAVELANSAGAREALRRACAASLPAGPFTIHASAWTAIGTV
jgi:hypothetical protein